jgi:DNA-binding phage protein
VGHPLISLNVLIVRLTIIAIVITKVVVERYGINMDETILDRTVDEIEGLSLKTRKTCRTNNITHICGLVREILNEDMSCLGNDSFQEVWRILESLGVDFSVVRQYL